MQVFSSVLVVSLVLFLISSIPLVGANPYLFEDDFETGDLSRWTGEVEFYGVANTTSTAYLGFYGLNATMATSGWGAALVYRRISPAQNVLYVRVWVKFNDLLTMNDRVARIILVSNGLGFYNLATAELVRESGVVRWALQYRAGGVHRRVSNSTLAVQTDTWYAVELKADLSSNDGVADGSHALWVNGDLVLEVNNIDTDWWLADCVYVGRGRDATTRTEAGTHFFDNVVIDTSYIGTAIIYIRSDGSVDPPTAPITRDGDVYTLTDNIYDEIRIERSNMTMNGNGYTLQGPGSLSTGLEFRSCHNITIKNMEIKTFYTGILSDGSSNITIIDNNIFENNWDGIRATGTSNVTITGNNITSNRNGIYIDGSSLFSIRGNNIANNTYGIYLYLSSNNSIYYNNLNHNTNHAAAYYCEDTIWNNDYPSGGNYWSDYTDVDEHSGPNQDQPGSDYIWDHPYVIGPTDQDRYPLVYRWWCVADVNHDGVVDVLDAATISAHWYPGPPIGPLGYNPIFDTNGDGAINVLDAAIVSAYWTGPPKGPSAP